MKTSVQSVRLWDLPTRLFHWALVLCVLGAYITVKLGGLWMDWHIRFGLCVLGLILFRLIWGLIGPRYARFKQFVHRPSGVLQYLRGANRQTLGHSPLGALSVLALLLAFGFQAASGLFANDDVMSAGPLAYLDSDWSSTLTELHKFNEWIMIALVVLHVAAVVWYQKARRRNLVGPMIHGDVRVPTSSGPVPPAAQDDWKVRLGALLVAALITALVYSLNTLGSGADAGYM